MNYFKIFGKRQMLTVLLAAIIFAGVFLTALDGASASASAQTRKLPIYSVGREESDKTISISFDAACAAG